MARRLDGEAALAAGLEEYPAAHKLPSSDRVAVLRCSMFSQCTGSCEHSVCPFQSKNAGQGNSVEGKVQGLTCGSSSSADRCVFQLLLPHREAVGIGRIHRSAEIIWISLLVTYINYQFKL